MITKECNGVKRVLNECSVDKKKLELISNAKGWDKTLEEINLWKCSSFFKTFMELMDFKYVCDFKNKKKEEFAYYQSKTIFMSYDTYSKILDRLSESDKIELELESLD